MRRIGKVAAATVRGAVHQTALGINLLSIPAASYRFERTIRRFATRDATAFVLG
jgi:hypothetical protein